MIRCIGIVGSPAFTRKLHADEHAFTVLMQHLKDADPQDTVLVVQVENEAGLWGGARDHSAAVNRVFAQAVPKEVLAAEM